MSFFRLLNAALLATAWAAQPGAWRLAPGLPLRLAAVAGEARPYQADLSRSTVRFKATVNQFLVKEVKGTFHKFAFSGSLDAAHPEDSQAKIVIDVASVVSDTFGVSDGTLRSELGVPAHPQAVIETTAVRRAADDAYDVDVLARFMGQEYRSTLRLKVVRFQNYLRLLGTYSTKPDAQSRKADIEFSLYVSPQ